VLCGKLGLADPREVGEILDPGVRQRAPGGRGEERKRRHG
jgi:hypothetical protein